MNKLLVVLCALFSSAYAGTCSITSNNLMFGQYGGTSSSPAINGDAKLFVSCTDNNTYAFCASSPSVGTQTISRSGGHNLNYSLYKDVSRSTPLQTTDCFPLVGGTASSTRITKSCPYSFPCELYIYGKMAAGQTQPAGVYKGTFLVNFDVTGQSAPPSPLSVNVQAYIASGCNISADQFNFGTYVSSNPELKVAQSSIHVNCTKGTKYSVYLSPGSGTYSQRTLKSGSNALDYNLYLPDPATPAPDGTCINYKTVWKNTGGADVDGTGTGSKQDIQVCGKIPAGQTTVPAGNYQDTIIATVKY